MKRLSLLLGGCACAALLSGCSASLRIGAPPTGAPGCAAAATQHPERLSGPLVVTAQSVPTATRLPCLRVLPAGWTFHDMQAREGRTKMSLDFGENNNGAVTVILTRSCDIRTATRLAGDRSGTRRYEHIDERDSNGYRSERYLVFRGGCVTHLFGIRGSAAAEAAATVSRSLGLVERSTLRRYVREYSDGRIELDPQRSG